jgi:hypothetical protein
MNDQKKTVLFACLAVFLFLPCAEADKIDMKAVKELSKQPVTLILKNAPVKELVQENYWPSVRSGKEPAVVMFYTNIDQNSQNLATLIKYLSLEYGRKIRFFRYQVSGTGKPATMTMTQLEKLYSLDKVPGVLIYDNDTGEFVLEEEQYTVPAFKEYRTPGMMIWKVFYKKVKKIIEENILD